MWICKECFVDEEIRKEVENNSTEVRVCDICDKMGKACDLSCFDDFFISVIHLFKADEESPYTLVDILDKDWGIFSNPSYARTILNAVICVNRLAVNLDDKVSYIDDIMERVSVWEQLKTDVKENFRYFVDHDKFDEYADLSPSSTLRSCFEMIEK